MRYGNGAAVGLYQSNKVLTFSLHINHGSCGPSHPQDGSIYELGAGERLGYNLNIHLPNGTGDRGHGICICDDGLGDPTIKKFESDMIVLVVGQDSTAISFSTFDLIIIFFFLCILRLRGKIMFVY